MDESFLSSVTAARTNDLFGLNTSQLKKALLNPNSNLWGNGTSPIRIKCILHTLLRRHSHTNTHNRSQCKDVSVKQQKHRSCWRSVRAWAVNQTHCTHTANTWKGSCMSGSTFPEWGVFVFVQSGHTFRPYTPKDNNGAPNLTLNGRYTTGPAQRTYRCDLKSSKDKVYLFFLAMRLPKLKCMLT